MIVPLQADPNYEFQIQLDGSIYQMRVLWSETNSAWYLDLNGITDTSIVINGIKLVPGVDLLKPFAIYALGEMYIVDLSNTLSDPTYDTLGDRHVLYYIPVA